MEICANHPLCFFTNCTCERLLAFLYVATIYFRLQNSYQAYSQETLLVCIPQFCSVVNLEGSEWFWFSPTITGLHRSLNNSSKTHALTSAAPHGSEFYIYENFTPRRQRSLKNDSKLTGVLIPFCIKTGDQVSWSHRRLVCDSFY